MQIMQERALFSEKIYTPGKPHMRRLSTGKKYKKTHIVTFRGGCNVTKTARHRTENKQQTAADSLINCHFLIFHALV